MLEAKVRMGKSGRIVLPARLRHALRLQSGEVVLLRVEHDQLRLIPLRQAITVVQSRVRKYVPEQASLVDSLMDERHQEAKRE
jgi:antitoxin PrlF